MTFRKFTSVAEFDVWHDKYKADNGYPLPGRNAATGEIQPLTVGPTTDYVAPVEVDDTDVRVAFGDDVLDDAPGEASWAPTYKDDGTVDVAKSKTEPVKELVKELVIEPVEEVIEL